MAGGPGAAGVPASSARSPPRPHALSGFRVGRAEGWRRGGRRRRRAAARCPRSPGLSGSPRRPRGSPSSRSRGGGGGPAPSARPQRQKRRARRASGGGRSPRSGSPPRAGRRGDPSPQPAASSHASPLTSAPRDPRRPADLRADPAFRERPAPGLRPRPRGLPRTPRAAVPARLGPEARRRRSARSSALLCEIGDGRARRGRNGMKGVWGPGGQNDITSGIARLAQSCMLSQGAEAQRPSLHTSMAPRAESSQWSPCRSHLAEREPRQLAAGSAGLAGAPGAADGEGWQAEQLEFAAGARHSSLCC